MDIEVYEQDRKDILSKDINLKDSVSNTRTNLNSV